MNIAIQHYNIQTFLTLIKGNICNKILQNLLKKVINQKMF